MFVITNKDGMKINVGANVEKNYVGNPRYPSNCSCECDKSCDIGEYLDYKNCKYR